MTAQKTAKRRNPTTPPVPAPAKPVPVERWVTRHDLRAEFHIHLPTMQLIRWMKLGKFPMKHTVDGHDLWRESEVVAWLRQPR